MSDLLSPMPIGVYPRQDVAGRIKAIDDEIERLEDAIEEEEASIRGHEDEIDALEEQIAALKDDRDRANGADVDVFGYPAAGEFGERLLDEAMRRPAPPPYGAPLMEGWT